MTRSALGLVLACLCFCPDPAASTCTECDDPNVFCVPAEFPTVTAAVTAATASLFESTIRIDANDAAGDPARLADEAHTISMFGGKRLVWVKGSTQKNLANAVQPLLDAPPEEALVVIEAGDLVAFDTRQVRVADA